MLQSITAARKRSARFSLAVISSNIVLHSLVAGVVAFAPISAAAATTLLSDDFGTGSSVNDIPSWEEEGNDNNADALAQAAGAGNDSASPDGDRFAKIGEDEWICQSVNAVGYETLFLSYHWRGDSDAEAADDGIVEYRIGGSCGSGAGWNQLQNHDLQIDNAWSTQSAFALPGALDDTSFFLRYRTVSSSSDEYFRVDAVELTGEAIPTIEACNGSSFDGVATGTVNGKEGWSVTGPYDQAVVDNTYGYPTMGCKAFRISNAVTSGSFGDQVFTFSNANEAGETDATANGLSGGTRQDHYEAQFDIATTQSTQQAGLVMTVSPDRGDGSRMSFLRFTDTSTGILVTFFDVSGTTDPSISFDATDIGYLTRGTPHTVKFDMDFIDGPSNDVVKIYLDGALAHTGTSWENYYRYDNEAIAEQTPRTTDSLLFRSSGTAAPANSGNGFLFDNFSLTSSQIVVPAAACTPSDAEVAVYLPMDELHGPAADLSGNGNDGAHMNSPSVSNDVAALAHPNYQSLNLNGSSYLDLGDVADMGTSDYSVSLWFKTTDTNYSLFSKSFYGGANSRFFLIDEGAGLYAGFHGTSIIETARVPGYNNGSWHNAVVVFDRDGAMTLYVDGTPVASADISAQAAHDMQSAFSLLLGRYNNATDGMGPHPSTLALDGNIDDFRIFERALTANEITDLFAGACDVAPVVIPPTCGDSVIEGGETCDDGNTDSGDGCDMMCQVEPAPMCNGQTATIYVLGNNTIEGGPNDGAAYAGTLSGTSGNDVIVGTSGNDTINGLNGADTICAGAGHDVVDGGFGNDDIFGEDGNDSLRGGVALSDDLDGGDGFDYCRSTIGGSDNEVNCEENGALKGMIVIQKDTAPDNAQDFVFTGYNNIAPGLTQVFTLDDDADGTYSNIQSGGYFGGNYTVIESATSGWELTGLTCFDADGGSSTNVGTSTASIDLDIGEVVTCTFTNEEVIAMCGNGVIEGGEQCDDSNTDNGDGCSDMCQNQALACTPVDSDLIANWKLDETAPATVADDATTNGNDGSVTDATAGVTGAPALPFYNPSAYDFDGTDDSVAMASNVGNFSLADDFTISAWINPELDFSNQAIYGNTWSNAGYLLRVNAENKVRFILVENGSVYNGMDSDVLTPGWHHVVGSWDGTDVKVFVDGVDQSVTPITNGTVTTITTSNPTHIGQTGQAGSEQFFDGSIDDVRVYDRALTDMEVSDLYAGSCDVSPVISCTPTDDYLVAYWNLDEGVGSTLTDMSTYDNGGSVNGAAWTMSGPTLAFTTPYALSFDGVDDRVTVADDTDLDFGTNDAFSAAAWMNAGPLTGNFQTIVHKIDDTTSDRNGYLLTYNEGTLEVWIIADADVNNLIRVPASAPVAIDEWHHVGFTYDGSSTAAGVRIYIDGVDMTGAPLIDALSGSILNAKPFEMGYRSDAFAQPFSGMLDDVRVYSTDLSSSEMAELSAGQCDAGVTIPVVVVVDTDTDGIEDGSDNCPLTPNADQLNTDLDSDGDACDPDDDNDTILDNVDNCSLIANADQTDNDSDGEGNVCDATPGDAPTFSGLSAPDTEGSNSARRGSGTQKFGTVVKFIFRNIFGGNDSIAPGAFGGSAATPLTDGEIDTICSIRKALPTQTSSSMLEWIAEQLATDMNRDVDLIIEALKDSSLCQPAAQQAKVSQSIAFNVNSAGFPVSSNQTWNKCISGKVTLADIRANPDKNEDGLARDCSDYHTGGLWYHPDLKVYFNFDRKKKTVELPKGYVVQKEQSVTLK